MNEKIKQLAEQAQKVVGYTDGGYTEIKALDQEKFAELIIRECADIAENQGRFLRYDVLAKKIKENFEIKK